MCAFLTFFDLVLIWFQFKACFVLTSKKICLILIYSPFKRSKFRSGKLKVPEWTDLVKTAVYKELAPFDSGKFLCAQCNYWSLRF